MMETKHIGWIDGLKGLMAMIVVMSHLRLAFFQVVREGFAFYQFPLFDLSCGGMAVAAFVCLSAIVMTFKCMDPSKWQVILLKRYFRLALPIAPILLLYVLLWLAGLLYNNQLSEQMDNWWLGSYKPQFVSILKVILVAPFGAGSQYVNVLWMLAYIFATPFVVVLLDLATKGMSRKKGFGILLFSSLLAAIMNPLVISIFSGYGIAKYLMQDNAVETMQRRWIWLLLLPVLYAGVHYMPFFEPGHDVLKGIIIVMFVALAPHCQKVLSTRPAVWLGGISFEIYLLHLFVIFAVACRMYLQMPYFHHRLIVIYGCTLVLTVLLAWIWSIAVNRPINKVLRKL